MITMNFKSVYCIPFCCSTTLFRDPLIAVVLDKEALLGRVVGGITSVLSNGSLSVGLAPLEEGSLGGTNVGLVSLPDLEHSRLEGTTVREGHGPGPEGGHLVDGVQVHGGLLLALSSGEEGDSSHSGGHGPLEGSHCRLGNIVGRVLLGAVSAGADHVGLEEGSLEVEAVELAPGVSGGEDALSGGNGGGQIVVTIHEDLGLNNGDESVHLGDDGHAGEGLGVGLDGELGGHSLSDAEGAAPLGEAGSSLVVIGALLVEVVKTLGHGLSVGAGEGDEALWRRKRFQILGNPKWKKKK